MAMEITSNYSDYGKGYTNTAKEGNVTTSTVELKTSTGGTYIWKDSRAVMYHI